MHFGYGGFAGPWMWLGGLLWLFVLVGVGIALFSLARRLPAPEDPVRVLKMRYARGELTREQFLEMRRDLGGGDPPQA